MYKLTDKGERIRDMFDTIAPRYDLLNRVLSLGIDRRWRTFAVAQIKSSPGGKVLDIATGTGDVALEIARQTAEDVTITGADISREMVEIGKQKVGASPFSDRITFEIAPCEALPFADEEFDSTTIAFGIRNVVDRPKGLSEMHRVLRAGGRAVILEFSMPSSPAFESLYRFYFLTVLPKIGGLFSKQSAYQYLPDSVLEFPSRDEFKAMMANAGFKNIRHFDLTFGISTVYVGEK
jgi:demethylmenaquinone methyltransferase/2-methoxy-6-polyprenyl-1,4-benzoquinol methylase